VSPPDDNWHGLQHALLQHIKCSMVKALYSPRQPLMQAGSGLS
jgi:hypothetical protein